MMLKSAAWLRGIFPFAGGNDRTVSGVALRAQLRWQLRHGLLRLGWPGIVGISLLVICLTLYLSTILPLQARMAEAQHIVALAGEQFSKAGTHRGEGTPSEQLVKFYKFFPAEKNSPEWLEKLVVVAEKNGLNLNEGGYQVTRDKAGRLMRFRITLPVHGRYQQIREFLASLSTEIPIMALENVQFERNKIIESAVNAKVKLVLYLVQKS
jgi:hypothetical protein